MCLACIIEARQRNNFPSCIVGTDLGMLLDSLQGAFAARLFRGSKAQGRREKAEELT
jgi:hypothetical protein